jgi:hypothetical protein
MSAENKKTAKISRSNSESSSTRSGSFKTKKFKEIIIEDIENKIKNRIKNYGCGFTIDKIIFKSKYKLYKFNEEPNKIDDSFNLIDYMDEIIPNIYEKNDEIDIIDANKILYNLDYDNSFEIKIGDKKIHSIESGKDKIKENINALKSFIHYIKKNKNNYFDDIDFNIIVREDINALIIYLEINYDLYEYTFTRENRGKFLDEIVEFCKENSIIIFH